MSKKLIAALVVAAGAATAGYWYFSPYVALSSMRSAAQKHDADAFNNYVNYPQLRESIKGQFSALLVKNMGELNASGNPFAGLGAMLALTMADKMVDTLVRPEVVMQAMTSGKLKPDEAGTSEGRAQHTSTANETEKPDWTLERHGVDKVLVRADAVALNKDSPTLVFERTGFANWKLTEFRLPADLMKK